MCNLGSLIADEIAQMCHRPAYMADPVVVDEFMTRARYTGLPFMKRESIFHALNAKAASRRYARSIGRKYEEMNLVVAHLGGGICVSAHHEGKVIDVNNALNGEVLSRRNVPERCLPTSSCASASRASIPRLR